VRGKGWQRQGYIFHADGDNRVKLFVNSKLVLDKKTPGRKEISKHIKLAGGQSAEVRIEYIHAAGDSSLHVAWSGPGFGRRTLTPINNASVP